MSGPIHVGLIGYGYAGKTFHAPIITSVPGLQLTKVVERRWRESQKRYPWVEVVTDVRHLYDDEQIDLIVVTTPSTNHVEFVRDALLAGKHVVVEKPFTVSSADADDLIKLAASRGKVLSVFHNRRWDADFRTIQKIVHEGLIGSVVECEFHWDNFRPEVHGGWRESDVPGAGVLYDLGVHFLDQAVCLFGVPDTITADVRKSRPNARNHDYFDIVLGYNGKKVILKSSRYVREIGPRYTLHGTLGSFVKYGIDPQEEALIRGETPITSRAWGSEPRARWGTINTSVGSLHVTGLLETMPGAYQDYYQNICDHISGKAELAVTADEARTAIRLIELALQSHEEQRTLPFS